MYILTSNGTSVISVERFYFLRYNKHSYCTQTFAIVESTLFILIYYFDCFFYFKKFKIYRPNYVL